MLRNAVSRESPFGARCAEQEDAGAAANATRPPIAIRRNVEDCFRIYAKLPLLPDARCPTEAAKQVKKTLERLVQRAPCCPLIAGFAGTARLSTLPPSFARHDRTSYHRSSKADARSVACPACRINIHHHAECSLFVSPLSVTRAENAS
jgi:hypothetical protein